ncbi:MAG: DUF1549 domain-containing protein [Planctomycetaceae bacterium]|nr:DUF1549 domain-containing protein [Planctomycetaceae bacterium]MCB9950293.1 DUF1549 domain-containing protein [Planctomycetaceae bacterium]
MTLGALVGVCVLSNHAFAEDAKVLAPASTRFANAEIDETPDFQKHMSPLLGKLGCNGRSCHGSFQGRGGFRLSLFGYDFKMDREGLIERIDTDAPTDSYLVQKAINVEPHEGGKRMEVGSWEYNLFMKWIGNGAPAVGETPTKLLRLEVTPSEIQFTDADQLQQLKAVAVWEDGMSEDVTCLCRFQSNDDAVCGIDGEGLVTSGDPGDSHVVVFYDNAVVPVPVIRPVTDRIGEKYPKVAATTEVDRLVVEKLSKLGVIPSEQCTDAEFLRRVCLDLTATLPTAAEAEAFLADTNADKRARKVDELLSSEAYAAWWTTRLCDWTGCSDQQLQNVNPVNRNSGSAEWYAWIFKRVQENMPYDKLMEGIVVADSRHADESYRDYCERMTDAYRDDSKSFADQDGLMYFWGRRNFISTEDRAIGFAYTFMGTRIQCAQCHKHPFDVWTQADFQQFEKFFARVRFSRNGDAKEYRAILKEIGIEGKPNNNDLRKAIEKAVKDGKTVPFPELAITAPKNQGKNAPAAKTAKLLGEQEVDVDNIEDPRTALMDWLRNSPTKLFAKAFVNRVWSNYMGRGIVEPTDDLSLANPPSNAGLLNHLTDGFIANGYDMKWLHREIVLSDTYQRSWQPNETNAMDERNFSRAVVRRLPAEAAYDALTMATLNDQKAAEYISVTTGRAIRDTSPPRNNASNGRNYALAVFGRSIRESACDCDRSMEASLLQTLYTRNDRDVEVMLTDRNGWLTQIFRNQKAQDEQAERLLAQAEAQVERFEKTVEVAKKKGNEAQIAKAESALAAARDKVKELTPSSESVSKDFSADEVISQAYLRTLSRLPSADERTAASEYLASAAQPADGVKDLVWALINTKEFMLNH